MKTTLDLPDDLVREMKLRALMQGRTLRDLAADFLRQGLGMTAPRRAKPPPGSPVEISADGMPIIRGKADAPARRMSAEALIALEQAMQTEAGIATNHTQCTCGILPCHTTKLFAPGVHGGACENIRGAPADQS